ncbi:MAG TPA: LLM class flavin-dependent oxidoreductase [bacterium]|nr:LLM class flavin-dependent oxidoreductase [bacterium]
MRFAISIPQFVGDGAFDPARFRAHMAGAEALGYHSAWTQEQVLGSMPHLSPIETMTYAAACTERIRLGCAVFVTPLHSPVHLAKSLSTLDQLCRGRLEIGVGIGGRRMFAAFAVGPDHLATRFAEGLQLMKALWTEPRVMFIGRYWQVDDAAMEPKPLQKPHPPIWFGAAHPDAVRRAVRLGDGFFGAGSQPTVRFAEQVLVLRDALAKAGRSAENFPIAKRVYVAVDKDTARAQQRVHAALHALYANSAARNLESVAVFGPPEACAAGLRDVAAAGAQMILLTPLFDETEQMERLAADVIPRVLE